uniref:Phylloplanin n=1 Tax=Fagus sylvatica TaxID=28930 RepID=A0A2N9EK23_FAGSY
MALKFFLFVSLMVAAFAIPIAGAGLISGLIGLTRIQGTMFCTLNGNIGANDALVQLQCGAGNVVSSATTNGSGVFSILLDPLQYVLSSLLTDCNLVVNTPLSSCNAKLPSVGGLLSSLQFIGNTLIGLLNVANIIPTGFQFIPLKKEKLTTASIT